jgi:hypothetical protein
VCDGIAELLLDVGARRTVLRQKDDDSLTSDDLLLNLLGYGLAWALVVFVDVRVDTDLLTRRDDVVDGSAVTALWLMKTR